MLYSDVIIFLDHFQMEEVEIHFKNNLLNLIDSFAADGKVVSKWYSVDISYLWI